MKSFGEKKSRPGKGGKEGLGNGTDLLGSIRQSLQIRITSMVHAQVWITSTDYKYESFPGYKLVGLALFVKK